MYYVNRNITKKLPIDLQEIPGVQNYRSKSWGASMGLKLIIKTILTYFLYQSQDIILEAVEKQLPEKLRWKSGGATSLHHQDIQPFSPPKDFFFNYLILILKMSVTCVIIIITGNHYKGDDYATGNIYCGNSGFDILHEKWGIFYSPVYSRLKSRNSGIGFPPRYSTNVLKRAEQPLV
jgi:hypothetical protein